LVHHSTGDGLSIAAAYLSIEETKWGLPRMSWDHIQDCSLNLQLLDSSVGVFAITSVGALFAILGVQLLLLPHVHFLLLALCIGERVSWCFIPALPVWYVVVGVGAILPIPSPA